MDKLKNRIVSLEGEIANPDFWSNPDKKNGVMQELKSLKNQTESYLRLDAGLKDLLGMLEITEEEDAESLKHLELETDKISKLIGTLEFQKLLSGPLDKNSVILSINSGAGGTESCDWAAMLLRLYT